MSEVQDPRLAAAMAEVQNVLDKYDIAGAIVLADGLGHAEWRLPLDRPTWSMIRFLKSGKGIHTKAYSKSKPVETDRTINAVINTGDVLARLFMIVNAIDKDYRRKLEIEETESKWEDRDDET